MSGGKEQGCADLTMVIGADHIGPMGQQPRCHDIAATPRRVLALRDKRTQNTPLHSCPPDG